MKQKTRKTIPSDNIGLILGQHKAYAKILPYYARSRTHPRAVFFVRGAHIIVVKPKNRKLHSSRISKNTKEFQLILL
jgi:hypothetical protein